MPSCRRVISGRDDPSGFGVTEEVPEGGARLMLLVPDDEGDDYGQREVLTDDVGDRGRMLVVWAVLDRE